MPAKGPGFGSSGRMRGGASSARGGKGKSSATTAAKGKSYLSKAVSAADKAAARKMGAEGVKKSMTAKRYSSTSVTKKKK